MAESAHSEWSASKLEQKMLCPGSHVMQQGLSDRTSRYAAEGTAAHNLLEMCLRTERPAEDFLGEILQVQANGEVLEFEVDDDMADHVQWTVDRVREYQADGALMPEQRVHYHEYLGVPKGTAWGTSDVVILRGDEIIVIDLKYGKGNAVDAERNPQLMIYALGALYEHQGLSGDFTRVRVVILQPRIVRRPVEWDISVEELEAWGYSTARSAVATCLNADNDWREDRQGPGPWRELYLRPGEKQCQFCKAQATCPALRSDVAGAVFNAAPASPEEFADLSAGADTVGDDLAWLGVSLSKVDMIESWCNAVRSEAERRMLAGDTVPGHKLVQGRMGNRAWTDTKAAEEALKAMRLKQNEMYTFKVISPTQAEKVLKESPRRWAKMQPLISRAEGKLHVAPLSDKRDAITVKPVAEEFENLDAGQDLT